MRFKGIAKVELVFCGVGFNGKVMFLSEVAEAEGHEDWDAPEYTDTVGSKEKKVTKALSFYKMETDEVSERYIAPCFMNGLEAYDGEINLALDENLISNEYAVKLCLDYEVKKGNKVVKKEHIVALKGELYFVKFIINPKEDDVEPGVIFGGPFIRLVNGIVDFGSGVITVYPEQDLFEDDFEKTEKSMGDWDQLLDCNFDDIPQLDGEELPPFVCKIGKSSRNKKRPMENLNLFFLDIGPSLSIGRNLTQEEATKEALALRISQEFALLEEVRPVLKTMAYNDKYKKVLDEIWKDKVELDGMIIKEEEEAINKVKGEALKEKDDPRAFIFPIRFEGKINENALADTGSDINTMPYRIYAKLGREEITKVDRGITMINHTQAKPLGLLTNVHCLVGVTTIIAKFLILDIPIGRDASIVVGPGIVLKQLLWEEMMMRPDHQDPNALDKMKPWKRYFFHKFIMNSYYEKVATERRSLGALMEEGFDVYFQRGLVFCDDLLHAQEYWLSISRKENLSLSRSHVSNIRSSALREIHKIITYCLCQRTTGKARVLSDVVLRSLSASIYCRDLDTTTLRELIDSEGRLIPKDPQPGVPRVAIPRPPRALMYVGVFEHMARVYSVPLQGAYNPPGYAQPQYDQYYQQYPPQQ
ncbi:hypothetical protein Tco_0226237 [Tanacetum coccineum]